MHPFNMQLHKDDENFENDIGEVCFEKLSWRTDRYIDGCLKIAYCDDKLIRHSRTSSEQVVRKFRLEPNISRSLDHKHRK